MITVTLSTEEIRERSQALAQYANKLIELEEEEEDVKAGHKSRMARLKERHLEISGEIRRLSRAVRLGVEERSEQRVLFEEEQRRQAEPEPIIDTSPASDFIEEAEEEIERQQQAAEQAEQAEYQLQADGSWTERERLHKEAVATWRRERPAQAEEAEKEEDYQAEWLAGLTVEQRNTYYAAPCKCGHNRDWHSEEDRETCDRDCRVCEKCKGYHCPACNTKGGHQATCEHYVLGEGTPVQNACAADNFTAERCDECKRTDGAHAPECSKSSALTYDDYLMYAQANYKRNWSSYARKMELNRDPEMDAKVARWIEEKNTAEIEAEEPEKDEGQTAPPWTAAPPISDQPEKAEMRKENAKRIEKRIKNAQRKNLRAV